MVWIKSTIHSPEVVSNRPTLASVRTLLASMLHLRCFADIRAVLRHAYLSAFPFLAFYVTVLKKNTGHLMYLGRRRQPSLHEGRTLSPSFLRAFLVRDWCVQSTNFHSNQSGTRKIALQVDDVHIIITYSPLLAHYLATFPSRADTTDNFISIIPPLRHLHIMCVVVLMNFIRLLD